MADNNNHNLTRAEDYHDEDGENSEGQDVIIQMNEMRNQALIEKELFHEVFNYFVYEIKVDEMSEISHLRQNLIKIDAIETSSHHGKKYMYIIKTTHPFFFFLTSQTGDGWKKENWHLSSFFLNATSSRIIPYFQQRYGKVTLSTLKTTTPILQMVDGEALDVIISSIFEKLKQHKFIPSTKQDISLLRQHGQNHHSINDKDYDDEGKIYEIPVSKKLETYITLEDSEEVKEEEEKNKNNRNDGNILHKNNGNNGNGKKEVKSLLKGKGKGNEKQ